MSFILSPNRSRIDQQPTVVTQSNSFFGVVAPIEQTTQQSFLIGPFANQTLFIDRGVFYDISRNLHRHLM